jgi:hypothetical protein
MRRSAFKPVDNIFRIGGMGFPRGCFRAKCWANCAFALVLCTIALLVAGCGTTAYVDSRREAGQTAPVGTSTLDMVAICYSKSPATTAAALKLAESECAKTDRRAQFHHEERWACAMVAPRRIFYRCVAKP